MKTTLLQFLSVAACIAAVSPGLAAQGGAAKIRVLRAQPPVAKQLAEVIDMLDADGMTEAQQRKAQAVLKDIVERLQHDQKQGAFGGFRATAPQVDVVGRPEISIVEVDGDEMAPAETPRAAVRARVLRVDADGDGPAVARSFPGGTWAPTPPKPPSPAAAPEAPDGGVFVISGDGEDAVWPTIEADVAKARDDAALHAARKLVEAGQRALPAHRAMMQLDRERSRAAKRQMMQSMDEAARAESADESEAPNAAAREDHVWKLRLQRAQRDAAKADGEVQMLLERSLADGKRKRVAGAKVEDVTDTGDDDDADLRAMIDAMRAEMREVRALMEHIREQAPASAEATAPSGR